MRAQRMYLAVLLMALFQAGPVFALEGYDFTDVVKESFKVRPGGTLYLDLDHGNISIEVGPDDAVYIEMERTIRVDDEEEARELLRKVHEYSFEQRGDDVIIESRYIENRNSLWNKWGRRNRLKISVRVLVPASYNLDFETGAGTIEVADLDGEVYGRTGAGNIVIGNVNGVVDISTGAGNVTVNGAAERVEVTTGAGNIELRDVTGFVQANTGAGNIEARIMSQPENESRLETGAGNVTVYLDGDVGVYVDAVASMGSASCDFPLEIKGKWMTKSFEGKINGGGPDLFIRAGVGNVTLRRR